LAELLTDGEVETLRHLGREGMGTNTLRTMASYLAYLEARSLAASGAPLPWPAPEALVLRFVAHHFYDPARRAEDASHGMPVAVEAALRRGWQLRANGPHAPSTVRPALGARWSPSTRPPASSACSRNCALSLGVSSRKLHDMAVERPRFVASLATVLKEGIGPVPGGILILDEAGAVIGAAGASGDSSDNDEAALVAGAGSPFPARRPLWVGAPPAAAGLTIRDARRRR
jgi:hypothetical protein